jgi:hypothetical protein
MEERRTNRNSRLLIEFTMIFALGIGTAIVAQTVYAASQEQSKSDIKKHTTPLTFRIELSRKKRCQESCVAVTAEVVNESDEALAIDTNGLRYQIALDKLRTLPQGSTSRSLTMQGDYGPDQYNEATYKVLGPRESYKQTFSIPFAGEFFNDTGNYRFSVTYGQFREFRFKGAKLFKGTVKSNEIDFFIQRCGAERIAKSRKDCK